LLDAVERASASILSFSCTLCVGNVSAAHGARLSSSARLLCLFRLGLGLQIAAFLAVSVGHVAFTYRGVENFCSRQTVNIGVRGQLAPLDRAGVNLGRGQLHLPAACAWIAPCLICQQPVTAPGSAPALLHTAGCQLCVIHLTHSAPVGLHPRVSICQAGTLWCCRYCIKSLSWQWGGHLRNPQKQVG